MSVFATTLLGILYYLFYFSFLLKGKVLKETIRICYRGTSPCWSTEGRCQYLVGGHHAIFFQNMFKGTAKLCWLS